MLTQHQYLKQRAYPTLMFVSFYHVISSYLDRFWTSQKVTYDYRST